jgi:hypothetical protein
MRTNRGSLADLGKGEHVLWPNYRDGHDVPHDVAARHDGADLGGGQDLVGVPVSSARICSRVGRDAVQRR